MPATFSRIKVWTTEVVTPADLNAEFDNILANLGPAGVGGLQATLTEMRATLAPSESALSTSLAQEIEELRYMLLQLAGGNSTYWYSTPTTSLTDLKNAIGGALVNNRLVSGSVSTTSSAPRFLTPSGSTDAVTVRGTSTPLAYVINGTAYTLSADVTVTGMSLAASSSNTAVVVDSSLAGAQSSKWQGEDGTTITIGSVGTNISNLVGQLAAFKIVHSAVTEYFIGYVASATTITNCFRGFFVDSTRTPIDRVAVSNGDTITVMKLTWLYLSTTGTLTPNYTNPVFAAAQPTSPNTGDYWYDLTNNTWKVFGGVSYATSNSILIGVCIQDTSNCVGARAFNFYTGTDSFQNLNLQYSSTTTIQQLNYDGRISVNGNVPSFSYTRPVWDITANLESGQTRTTSTTYYAYVSEFGQQYLSSKKPYDLRGSLKGWYHPTENWRAVATIATNSTGSGNFDPQTLRQYDQQSFVLTQSSVLGLNPKSVSNIGLKASVAASAMTVTLTQADGVNAPNTYSPVIVPFAGATVTLASYIPRYITSTLAITVPSTATLGMASAVAAYVWVYLIDDAGTIDIGVSFGDPFNETAQSSTAISVGATAVNTLYSVSAHTSCAIRLIGRLSVTEATAGTWATAPSEIDIMPVPTFTATEWAGYSPAITGSPFNASGLLYLWRRVGCRMEVFGAHTNGVVAAAVGAIPLPTGSLDSAKLIANGTGAAGSLVGQFLTQGAAGAAASIVTAPSTSATNVYIGGLYNASVMLQPAASAANSVGINSTISSVRFEVPILGWYNYGA